MKNTLYAGACAAALILAAPTVSQAASLDDPTSGWYVSMFGGVSLPETMKSKFLYSTTLQYKAKTTLKDGFMFGAAVGTNVLIENLRAEVEFAFASHKGKKRVETGPTGGVYNYENARGGLKSYTIMGNLWYDIANETAFTPYVGGGIGVGFIDSNQRYSNFGPVSFKDKSTAFAFQVGAGVNYAVTPAISLNVGYRFKGITDFDLKQTNAAFPLQGKDKGLDLYSHNVLAGITIKFDGM